MGLHKYIVLAKPIMYVCSTNSNAAMQYHVVFLVFGLEHLGDILEVVSVGCLHSRGWEGHGCTDKQN